MKSIQKLEKEISQLPPAELAEFRAWFEKFDSDIWDKQFENDIKAGKLDEIAHSSLSLFKESK